MTSLPPSVTPDAIAGHMDSAPVNNNFGAFATAFNNLLTILSGGSVGQVLESAGVGAVTWGTAQKVTLQNFTAGPPAAPSDGDIWIATNPENAINAANSSRRWQFQYHAGSVSSSKWESLGGAPVFLQDVTGLIRQNSVDATWQALPGASTWVADRAGDYEFRLFGRLETTNAGNTIEVALGTGTGATYPITLFKQAAATGTDWTDEQTSFERTLALGDSVSVYVKSSAHTLVAAWNVGFAIVPVRVA